MTKKKVWEKKSFWLILLGVLCMAIVGLGVVVILNRSSGSSEISSINNEETLNNILQSIAPMSIEDTQIYLDDQLEIFSGTDLEQSIRMMKLNAFINAGLFEDAIAESLNIKYELLPDSEKLNFYSALNNAYVAIGDDDNAGYYERKFIDLYYDIVGEEGNFNGL